MAWRHALNTNLIFTWLKDGRFAPADAAEAAPVFLPVEVQRRCVPDHHKTDERRRASARPIFVEPRLFASGDRPW
jgi:hypothetical protein